MKDAFMSSNVKSAIPSVRCKKCERMKREIRDVLAKWSSAQEILLKNGEMTRGELMTAKAVVTGLSSELERIMGNEPRVRK